MSRTITSRTITFRSIMFRAIFSHSTLFATAFSFSFLSLSAPPEVTEIWRLTEGLEQPESVIFDPIRSRYYVSNMAGDPLAHDGKGGIAIVSADGKLVNPEWITGLDAPKGMTITNNELVVTDINRVCFINLEDVSQQRFFIVEGAKSLNDVTVSEDGTVYVSDVLDNTLYRIRGNQLDQLLSSADLQTPNGLYAYDNRLYVASWGDLTDGFNTEVPGHVKALDISSGELRSLGEGNSLGNLDGLERLSNGSFFATDWMQGSLLHVSADGSGQQVLQLEQGSADLTVVETQSTVVIPLMLSNQVVAYKYRF